MRSAHWLRGLLPKECYKPRLIPLSVAAAVQIDALWCALSLPPRLGLCCHQSRQPHNWQRTEPLRNPEGTPVLLIRSELAHAQQVTVRLQQRDLGLELPPNSILTLSLRKNLNNHRVSRIGIPTGSNRIGGARPEIKMVCYRVVACGLFDRRSADAYRRD